MDSFANHPYWTSEYIGLGPFKLDHWEPGTAIEVSAFDGHVLGKPKIARMRIVFIADGNTTLANMIAGEVHLSADTSLRVGNVPTLRQEWGPGGGSVVLHPNQWRATNFQMRPELASPPAILDPRARKALAHTIDKEPINEAVYHGNSVVAHTIVPASSEMGKAVDAAITKYAYDLRQAERLMGEAGFTKGSDGTYTSPSGGRFSGELKTNGAADNEAEISILASGWKQAGFDIAEAVNPTSLARDGKVRATFPSMFSNNTTVGLPSVLNMVSARIPREETRWQGGNRGGWSNPTYDRLVDAFGSELDRNERTRLLVDAMKVLNDDLPAISLFYRTQPWAHVAALTGPKLAAPDANVSWDIYAWEFR
jgi:peptide/nickel transport system substrate-binding protein